MTVETYKHSLPSKITFGFEQLSQIIRSQYWDKLKTAGISPIQFQMLRFLAENENHKTTIGTLANKFTLSYATISDSVKILADKKIVFKKQDQKDKRIFYVELTPHGRQFLSEFLNWDDKLKSSLTEFDSQFLVHLNSSILQLIESFEAKELISKTRLCLTCTHFRRNPLGIENDEHHCTFFDLKLKQSDLRIDCDQHVAIVIEDLHSNGKKKSIIP